MSEIKFTPGPWSPMWQNSRAREYSGGIHHWEVPIAVGARTNAGNAICLVSMGGPGATLSTKESVEANAHLIAAAPDLYEALEISHACGDPTKVSCYDEEGVEGWRWIHPDGREWTELGLWDDGPPMHPVAAAAAAKARGESQ